MIRILNGLNNTSKLFERMAFRRCSSLLILNLWRKYVRNKKRRMGWKYPPEIYAARIRRHGSAAKDPREREGRVDLDYRQYFVTLQ